MKNFDIKKILASLKPTPQKQYRSISAKAHHDWKVVILLFSLVWVAVFLASLYIFFVINNGDFFQNDTVVTPPQTTINKKALSDTVDFYSTKAQKLNQLETNPPKVVDPSI
jgi:hypothetical protein